MRVLLFFSSDEMAEVPGWPLIPPILENRVNTLKTRLNIEFIDRIKGVPFKPKTNLKQYFFPLSAFTLLCFL